MHSFLVFLTGILPPEPTGTPAQIAQHGIDFFSLWIARIGGLVAFVGAIKFALGIHSEDARDQIKGLMTMISGFMIAAAVGGSMNLFNIPATYTTAAAETEFSTLLSFIGKWVRRAGAVVVLIGAIMFGLAAKDSNPGTKVTAMKTIVAGGVATSVAVILSTFV